MTDDGLDVRHDVTILSGGHRRTWATCSCGWKSQCCVNAFGASYFFAMHLREQQPEGAK